MTLNVFDALWKPCTRVSEVRLALKITGVRNENGRVRHRARRLPPVAGSVRSWSGREKEHLLEIDCVPTGDRKQLGITRGNWNVTANQSTWRRQVQFRGLWQRRRERKSFRRLSCSDRSQRPREETGELKEGEIKSKLRCKIMQTSGLLWFLTDAQWTEWRALLCWLVVEKSNSKQNWFML